jgi:WxcM-like, C-terminal
VFASHPYDPADYIREYEQFLLEVGDTARQTN